MMPRRAADRLTSVNRRLSLSGCAGGPTLGTLSHWLRRHAAEAIRTDMVIGREDEPLLSVVGRMRAADADCAAIVDQSGRAIGVLGAADIVPRVVVDAPPDQAVRTVLTGSPALVRMDERLYRALARMERDGIAIAVAVDPAGRPRGILRREAALASAITGLLDA